MNITDILLSHAKCYPLMQPADAVKLLYQSEFGGEYIADNARCSLQRLKQEMKGITVKADIPLFESIGTGFVRVNLAALPINNISIYTLDALYILSTKIYKGQQAAFLEKLEQLKTIQAEQNIFAFSSEELSAFLSDYAAKGYPMIPHSDVYKQAYRPAYRVIHEELMRLYVFET